MNDKEILSTDEKSIVEKIIANRKMHENTVLLFDESHLAANAFCRIATMKSENMRLTERLKNAVVLPLLVTFKNGDCEIAYIMRSDDNFITVMHFTGINAKSEAEARLAEIKAKEK